MHTRYTEFACGLNLGPANAFTAFAIVEKTVVEKPDPNELDDVSFSVRNLERSHRPRPTPTSSSAFVNASSTAS